MNNLFEKFKPFKSEVEKNVMPNLAFGGVSFPEQESFTTSIEDPNDKDNFVVINRGHQKDCEMIEGAVNDVIQKCLQQFLVDNADDILDILHGFKQAQRESRLKSLGYEIDEEKILDIRSGRSLI